MIYIYIYIYKCLHMHGPAPEAFSGAALQWPAEPLTDFTGIQAASIHFAGAATPVKPQASLEM